MEKPLEVEKASRTRGPKTGEGVGASDFPHPAHRSVGGHVFLVTFPHQAVNQAALPAAFPVARK